ncbi:MAG: toll/interleukin-1 receptor domain-containing protein [Lachnospiraceae bacterium]|nr:toll/interleukin-1 receptor domain-containing protein [Lachnospiraceae bacterium]
MLLSKFGIEYVKDPKTQEMIPTCHRVQSGSILSDPDYIAAIENAPDYSTQRLYEEEGKRIAEIQKRILAIVANEKPYDVFICYKESTDGGSRTKDSVLAQDIYYSLTKEGYNVFFSRITLEKKLGQEYEPYIFAALNSAKVMLVIGTDPDYFKSIWVRNEWSRFLALSKRDRLKLLIPCYSGMDPYDLPDELSMLQAQDMGKIGFIQDLLHGINKVMQTTKLSEDKYHNVTQNDSKVKEKQTNSSAIESLFNQAMLYLEKKEWQIATSFLNQLINIDPEYAPAYIGKLCVGLGLQNELELAKYSKSIAGYDNYQKALQFANEQQRVVYEGYELAIQARIGEKETIEKEKAEQLRSATMANLHIREQQEHQKRKLENLGIFDFSVLHQIWYKYE